MIHSVREVSDNLRMKLMGVLFACLVGKKPMLPLCSSMRKEVGTILILCISSLFMVFSHVSVAITDTVENYSEREPDDRDSGGYFDFWSEQSQESELEPGDVERGGGFGATDFSGDEISPDDLDREGDFSKRSSQPQKKLHNTIQETH